MRLEIKACRNARPVTAGAQAYDHVMPRPRNTPILLSVSELPPAARCSIRTPTSELEQRLARCNPNWVRVQTEVKHALAGQEHASLKAALFGSLGPPSD